MAKGTFRGFREPDPDEPWRIHVVLRDVSVEPPQHPESKRVEPWPPPEWFDPTRTHAATGEKLPTAEDFARMTPYELATYSPPWDVMRERIVRTYPDPNKMLKFWAENWRQAGFEVDEHIASIERESQLSLDDADETGSSTTTKRTD